MTTAALKIVEIKMSILNQQTSTFDGIITRMGTYFNNATDTCGGRRFTRTGHLEQSRAKGGSIR